MTVRKRLLVGALALALSFAVAPPAFAVDIGAAPGAADIVSLVQTHTGYPVKVSVYATGLNNPRGLKFGPDGYLYVAEGGRGGWHQTTAMDCTQVPEVGPYSGSYTGGRISRIDHHGHRVTITNKFPSSQTSAQTGSLVSGVADVAFIGHTLYAITAGAGCSHGLKGTYNGIARVDPDGSIHWIANLSRYQKNHPVQNPEEEDFEPDGTWYSMVALHGELFALEPNHGELVKVSLDGKVRRVIDVSASQGHIVPTALAHRGRFFIGNLGTFPITAGSSKVLKLTRNGQLWPVADRLTTVLGIAFDRRGCMYVLEDTTGKDNLAPTPGTGKVVRIEPSGDRHAVVTGLVLPSAMTFGPDGALYVSNAGFGLPPGMGQVLRFDFDGWRHSP
ncbi:ScyD/ScyE family protein [Frateuria edaphi]|uniref:ScyD/ScyE family protein n=1 Tax=Frateuria edaphi TaxID=2898793 RepID=UPI001E39E6F3|nr:ScyD/ScyE family protein [Frateuria edaphi]UGB44583.1 ScyD/ScyE family protein [Frateuria edaphi]